MILAEEQDLIWYEMWNWRLCITLVVVFLHKFPQIYLMPKYTKADNFTHW